jgi:putative spermidine/putrescine transport system permease protein
MEQRSTKIALGVWVGLVLLFLYIPIVVICLYAFDESNVQSWPISGLTTKWFGPAIHNPDMQQALWLSLEAAALSRFCSSCRSPSPGSSPGWRSTRTSRTGS